MLNGLEDVTATVSAVYQSREIPKYLRLLLSVRELKKGADPRVLAKTLKTTAKRLKAISSSRDPIKEVLKTTLAAAAEPTNLSKARKNLGQMLLGTISERAFEDTYKKTMGAGDLRLEDSREGRTDTDYRVLDGQNRQVFRINIKFHGSQFRNAKELVGLEPEDCFALATYKIQQGLQKHEAEALPYLFVVVGVPGLRGETVGEQLPSSLAHFCSLVLQSEMPGKRAVEDEVVRHLVDDHQPHKVKSIVAGFREQIDKAPWSVLSARKADALLRKLLFERVYAVRVRGFAMNYRGAELDMHFSISKDLTPLDNFLKHLSERGLQGLATLLERGDV